MDDKTPTMKVVANCKAKKTKATTGSHQTQCEEKAYDGLTQPPSKGDRGCLSSKYLELKPSQFRLGHMASEN